MTLMYLRWCILVPLVVMSTPLCVMYRGSDAVNVAMDTVAIMFVLNIDTLVFNHGISEDLKGFVVKYGKQWYYARPHPIPSTVYTLFWTGVVGKIW
jgi:hypothetical protein